MKVQVMFPLKQDHFNQKPHKITTQPKLPTNLLSKIDFLLSKSENVLSKIKLLLSKP